jgi:hypothetical protein
MRRAIAGEALTLRRWIELMMEPPDLPSGVACAHPGCLNHVSHPCEGCGRIGGDSGEIDFLNLRLKIKGPVVKKRPAPAARRGRARG